MGYYKISKEEIKRLFIKGAKLGHPDYRKIESIILDELFKDLNNAYQISDYYLMKEIVEKMEFEHERIEVKDFIEDPKSTKLNNTIIYEKLTKRIELVELEIYKIETDSKFKHIQALGEFKSEYFENQLIELEKYYKSIYKG